MESEPEYGSGSRSIPMVSAQDVKYIRITDFDDEGIPPGHEFVTAETVEKKYTLQDGDVLFARSGATAGKTFIYSQEIGEAIFAGYCIRFRFNPELVLPRFAYYCTKTNRFAAWVRSMQRPSGQPNINKEEFKTFTIPLLPLDIQQAFVDKLEAARAARKQKLAEADALLAGVDDFVLQQLGLIVPQEEKRLAFAVRLGQCKGGRTDALYNAPHFLKVLHALENSPHKKVLLGTLSPELAGGATPTRGDADLYAAEGIKFLRILNIAPFEVVLNDLKHIQESVNDGELARSKLAANDVLMTITGRVGTAAVVLEETLPANINQHIVRLRIQGNDCLPEYLAAWLNSSIGNTLSNRGVTGGTRIALDYEAIRNLLIPLPPLTIQQAITAEVTRRREQARRLRDAANTGWQAAKARFEQQLLGESEE